MGCIEAGLDEVLALRLGDQRLELGGGKGVDQARLRDNQEEDLGAREGGEFVCLIERDKRGCRAKPKRQANYLFHNAWKRECEEGERV